MNDHRERALEAWLKAEEAEDQEAAEAHLAALFQALPRPQPTSGFAWRVMMRTGLAAPIAAARALRALAAAVLVVVGAGIALLPGLLAHLRFELELADLMARLASGIIAGSRFLSDTLMAWQKASALAPGLASHLDQPAVAAAAVALLAAAALAFRLVAPLVYRDRSFVHASV